MYLPIYNGSAKRNIFKIPAALMCVVTVLMPLLAFIACVLVTMYKDFDRANNTHCKVPNIFPSISAAIGNYEPQITLWKSAIYIHAPLRFFIIYHLRWKYYRNVIRENCMFVVKLAVFLNIIENIALLGLTVWTSTANYPYHEMCFKTFIGSSIFYMFFTSLMLTKYRRRPNLTKSELKSVKYKWRAFFINVVSFGCAAYFFLRHNRMCEPYVYSMFGFSEYIVVISNIAFHLTTVYDIQTQYIYFTKQGIITD